ncbi:glycosyl hydrolase family 28-related protein [Cohnella abietis]|uniref:Rhamnogalacturonase A/B/Epimerase-like pectate lyase domain-containing protein n=1 Tax=Cohnella abietis TaxID=2507935 RepID=A0A3T1D132_9BACL|nr:glycosyl hydrolase family 28-related protein [Cohnella abietis]BBI31794.1 hypothetical protein KCTCHS21_11930 [Cohnella abietis]
MKQLINVKDSPYKAVGDGKADDTKAIQKAIDAAGLGGNVSIPKGNYRITDTLNIGFYPGLSIDGENWEGTVILMDASNRPIFRFNKQDTHTVTLSNLNLQYKTQQTKDGQPNSSAIEYTNSASNESGMYHHIYRKVRVTYATYGFNINSKDQLPIWGCKWEDIIMSNIGTTCFRIRSGQPVGKPMNMFENIKIFQNAKAVSSYAFDMQSEFLIDALDIEGWKNGILINDSGFNCVIRYVHAEHHVITEDYSSLFILQDGSYDVSAIDVSIKAWTNSQHTLLQGNPNSTLNARNIRVHSEDTLVGGNMSIIGTFRKAVVAGLQKGSDSDRVDSYTGYLNYVWNIYSVDGLPPYIEDGYALPVASNDYRGRMFYKRVSKGSDLLYLCIKDTNNAFTWKDITSSGGGVVSPHASTHISGGTDTIPNAGSGSGLMTSSDKAKLDKIDQNANYYVHPDTHPATIIVEDSKHRFVTDADKVAWNNAASGGGTTVKAEQLATLPAANADSRGRIVLLLGAVNTADATYVCKKLADNTYDWKQID